MKSRRYTINRRKRHSMIKRKLYAFSAILLIFIVLVQRDSWEKGKFSKEYADEVVTLVNQERTLQGLQPLGTRLWLTELAEIRAKEQSRTYGHTRPDGTSCFTVFEGQSYQQIGENVAMGYEEPGKVMTAWMESDGHRENILEDFQDIGVGVYIDSKGVVYWSQLFYRE